MNNWLLRNGRLFIGGRLHSQDVWIRDGRVAALDGDGALERKSGCGAYREVDLAGKLVARGFVDLHVHLREPGFSHKETIACATRAAAHGGFTSVCAMPNTEPSLDSPTVLAGIGQLVRERAQVRVSLVGSVTRGRRGQELVDFVGLRDAGIRFFSDDGDPVTDALIEKAMQKIAEVDGVLANHLEQKALTEGAMFHPQIPSESEYLMLQRDLRVAARTRCRYHAAHLSCAESVALVATAKKQGIPVTAEVTPHHLCLTCDDIVQERAGDFQMKPPLRAERDRQALIAGVVDGTIDAIATDHAPHGAEKLGIFNEHSPFGVTGLETAFPALYTTLVQSGHISLETLLRALTVAPAAIAGEFTELAVGAPADLVVLDLEETRNVTVAGFVSKGVNSPFTNRSFYGWPIMTLVGGRAVYQKAGLCDVT